jgi:hypothetical protein
MPIKKIFLSFSFLFLCKVSFALIYVPEPFAKYNATKSHYLVSVPELHSYDKGYTAVFETGTNKFLYKIDQYFSNYEVFLSDDGTQLMYLETKTEDDEDLEFLHFHNGKEITSTIEVFRIKNPDDAPFRAGSLFDIDQEPNTLSFITSDLIYDVNLEELTISSHKNDRDPIVLYDKLSEDRMNTDSIMNIQNIYLKENQSLKERILIDLDLEEASDAALTETVIYYEINISKDNAISRVVIMAFGAPKSGGRSSNYKHLKKLEEEIRVKIKSYDYADRIIPEGVDYWTYSGVLNLAKPKKK